MAQDKEKLELRRDVTVWGSFMWGYADVGANVYVALGLVITWTQGLANLAFALAGIVYIIIGLAYTELSSTYPVAGGGQYFALRGLGDFSGFLAGAGLLLTYTIDIALFSVASAGYVNFFLPFLGIDIKHYIIPIGPFRINYLWCLEALILIGFLTWLNIIGMRESSLFNELIGIVDICTESAIIIFGFIFAWKPEILMSIEKNPLPDSLGNFLYGSCLAIICFVGLESISQAAQETKRPATIVPRTTITLIFTVFIFATAFSTLGLGIIGSKAFEGHESDPVAYLAHNLPYIKLVAGPFAAILGATILLISSNSGIMSASRLAYAVSQFGFLSNWFQGVHPKYRTPYRAIIVFTLIGAVQTVLSFLTPRVMDTLANMYAFGAAITYILVLISLIKLRIVDPYTPRPYKVPFNIPFKKKEAKFDFPVVAVLGICVISMILFMVVFTNPVGRIAGPLWMIACFAYYAWYRKSAGYPIFGSLKRNWEEEQMKVLESAGEFELLEKYKLALSERDKNHRNSKG